MDGWMDIFVGPQDGKGDSSLFLTFCGFWFLFWNGKWMGWDGKKRRGEGEDDVHSLHGAYVE